MANVAINQRFLKESASALLCDTLEISYVMVATRVVVQIAVRKKLLTCQTTMGD